jgi:hypothetical protein
MIKLNLISEKTITQKQFDKRLLYTLITIIILSFFIFIGILDLLSIPSKYDLYENDNYIHDKKYINTNNRTWEYNIRNGYVSGVELVIFYICNGWLFLRLIDLFFLLIKPIKQ